MTGRHALSTPAGLSEQSARAFPGWNDKRRKAARKVRSNALLFLRLKEKPIGTNARVASS
jgi:hypothetical protein